ncbi:MAG: hypothetical protein ACR2NP_04130 [Pirellulaceae bacterium]
MSQKLRMPTLVMVAALIPTVTATCQDQTLPTADEVITDFIEALGGPIALSDITTCRMVGSFSFQVHRSELEIKYKNGRCLVHKTNPEMSFGNNRRQWWWQRGQHFGREPVMDDDALIASQMFLASPWFLGWQDYDGSVSIVGESVFHDKPAWRLRFANNAGFTVDRYFDKETGLLLGSRSVVHGDVAEWELEFRETDGVLWVSRALCHARGQTAELVVNEVELEVLIDSNEFGLTKPTR